jgi:hypothetical protein
MVRVNRQIVDPSAMAVVPDHDGPDQSAVFLKYQETVRVDTDLAIDVPMGVIPRARQSAQSPERHEGFGVARPVGSICGGHERSLAYSGYAGERTSAAAPERMTTT